MAWGKLDDSLYDHPKLEELPTDPEACEAILASLDPEQLVRLCALGLWARSISWSNRFLTDGDVPRGKLARLDGSTELADVMAEARLFDRTARGYAIHDFLDFNESREVILERREKERDRKAEWRANKGGKGRPGGTTSGTDPDVPPGTEPGVPQGQPTGQGPVSRRDSRTRDPGGRARGIPTRPDPTRPDHESLSRDSARAGERADVQALRDRGWKRVTKAQRAVLDEVLARHDVTGPAFAAEVIRNTPADADPLAAVMAADRMWQDAERRKADARDADWQATKASEKSQANGRVSWLEDQVAEPAEASA